MKVIFLFGGLAIASLGISQKNSKPVIDTSDIRLWPKLGVGYNNEIAISGDGKCFTYNYMKDGVSNRILQLKNGKTYSFPSSIKSLFSADSKRFIYLSGNTITDMEIESGIKKTISGVKNMQYPETQKGKILFYQLEGSNKQLIIEDLVKGDKKKIESVISFVFDKKGEQAAIYIKDNPRESHLKCIHLISKKQYEIKFSQGEIIESFVFSNSGKDIAYIKRDEDAKNPVRSLWLLKPSGVAQLKADTSLTALSNNECISKYSPYFSGDDRYLFFWVEQKTPLLEKKPTYAKLNIWNSHNAELPNACPTPPLKYRFSVSITGNHVVRLENDSIVLVASNSVKGDYVITTTRFGDQYWKKEVSNGRKFWMVSLKKTFQADLKFSKSLKNYYYSPTGEYIVYRDVVKGRWDYFSYNTQSGKIANLSYSMPLFMLTNDNGDDLSTGNAYPLNIIGWLPEENAMLIYDNFDILKLHLTGNKPVENITNGYGRKFKTRFAVTYEDSQAEKCYSSKDTLLLTALNTITKYNGFYKKTLAKNSDPDSLAMLPRIICVLGSRMQPPNSYISDPGLAPLKAADTNLWLLKCNSASSAPNYYLTSDFINYAPLTNIQPQSNYNWYTTELVHWRQYNAKQGTGILYKPENFDSTKKYPVIIHHYRELSQRLYNYIYPDFTQGPIDIPWFVSRGYLVLTPDVFLADAGSGPAAYDAVVSAAEWLGTLPFVDKSKIGLNGHSQAGFQTNYIVANTNLFAAALAGAGGADAIMSSFISHYCGIGRFRGNEERYRGTLWERYDLYQKNSPILKADKINTPLLLLHCPKDQAVPWELSVQLFLALWRLGKDAWLLEYEEGDHLLLKPQDYLDYTTRVTQFFDHYLKNAPAPLWMTKGVPKELKGIETGLELDQTQVSPASTSR